MIPIPAPKTTAHGVSVRDAAERLGRDRSLVLRFIRSGRLKAEWIDHPLGGGTTSRASGYWMIDRSDLERFARIPRPPGRQPAA